MMIIYHIYEIVMTVVLLCGLFVCGSLLVKGWYIGFPRMTKAERMYNRFLIWLLLKIREEESVGRDES